MSLGILAAGTLAADPQARTSSAGKLYATALLRVATEDEPIMVSAIAFSTTAAETLLAHKKGDIVSIVGQATLSTWTDREGKERHGLKVTASRCLSTHEAARQREKIAKAQAGNNAQVRASVEPSGARTAAVSADGELADDIPF
jgi:single-stranded DNA-binding protein